MQSWHLKQMLRKYTETYIGFCSYIIQVQYKQHSRWDSDKMFPHTVFFWLVDQSRVEFSSLCVYMRCQTGSECIINCYELVDCCFALWACINSGLCSSVHTNTQALLNKSRLTEDAFDEFVQSHIKYPRGRPSKARLECTVNNYNLNDTAYVGVVFMFSGRIDPWRVMEVNSAWFDFIHLSQW